MLQCSKSKQSLLKKFPLRDFDLHIKFKRTFSIWTTVRTITCIVKNVCGFSFTKTTINADLVLDKFTFFSWNWSVISNFNQLFKVDINNESCLHLNSGYRKIPQVI